MYALSTLQETVWPPNEGQNQALLQLFLPMLRQHPVLAPLLIGLMAGVCEEILFRGPVQSALQRRGSPVVTMFAGGLLFAAAHLDLPGMPFRTLLGMLLGWSVLRSGSIFPAMGMHAVIDSAHYGVLSYLLRTGGEAALMKPGLPIDWPVWLTGGTVLLVAGFRLFRRNDPSA